MTIYDGLFVQTPDDRYIGKVVRLDDQAVEVSFFHSLAKRETVRFAQEQCIRAYLQPEMRVYGERADGRWWPGRVKNYFPQDDGSIDYEIRFSNGEAEDINERVLEVRCLRPLSDPAEVLAFCGAQTQFLHDRRRPALESIINLEAASQGLAGLVSASIEFVPHQVAAIRRVLQDPLPRYLLADEVGLGKTIEAGAILRQWKLDDPYLDVAVLAPGPLVPQWRRELRDRFGLHEQDGGVRIVSHDCAPSIVNSTPRVVVIDEAHRVTGSRKDPASLAATRLARDAERLLLVSAIPPLADESAFLGLLKLIDPDVYDAEDLASFHARVEQRQEYGRLLLGLRPEASPFVLKQRANGARSAFPSDSLVQELSGQLLETNDENERTRVCAALRDHIADTYRIHHRIVRSRRSDCPDWVFHPRGPQSPEGNEEDTKHVKVDGDEDARVADLTMALEDWRLAACAALGPDPSEADEQVLARRFREILEALGQSVEKFSSQIKGLKPRFNGEEAILSELGRIAARPTPDRSRIEVATDAAAMTLTALLGEGIRAPKLVAFATEPDSARELARKLVERFGEKRVMLGNMDSDAECSVAEHFADDQEVQALVLDRRGEEGLNLHFAHALLHYDLPFSAERVEQRIGRLDRFGRTQGLIRQRVIVPSDEEGSPWNAWLELLSQGLGVFNRSISEVQFLLDNLEREMELALFRDGAAGLFGRMESMRMRIEEERQKLDEQYVLDQIALARESGERFAQALDDAEADEEHLAAPVDDWLFQVLQFRRYDAAEDGQDVFHLGWKYNTLLPRDPWQRIFGPALDHPLTWKRRVALRRGKPALLRPGAPLVEALGRLLRWDDRGTAFATWRVAPQVGRGEMWLGFRLCFVIEPNFPERGAVLSGPTVDALRRRALALFPPWTVGLHLDANLEEVTDPQILTILQEPFQSRSYYDVNLGSRLDALKEAVDITRFQDLCVAASRRGLELVRHRPEFIEKVADAKQGAREVAERRLRRLRSREAAGNADIPSVEIAFDERVVSAVSEPDVRLDSIGFFVVTDHKPQARTS